MALVRFGEFESDLQTGELFKQGQRIPLEAKPFRLLATLLERPGQLVTREELGRIIWPPGTYVDFGRCVNIAVTKLRHALADSSDHPRYIETLPKRGYRFITPVETRGHRLQSQGTREEGTKLKVRIAILPFETFCETQDQAQFSERLIDEIVSRIGLFYPEYVGVIARTSNLKYSAARRSISQIGRDLKVDHVLTGSLHVSGDHAQIDVQLTAIASQTPSWSERYDCNLGDALTVRSEVATKIARAIGLEVLSVPSHATPDHTRAVKDAHLEYLRGRLCHSRGTPAGFWKSIQYFERAIYLDPNCAPVFSGLANARGALGGAVFGAGHPRDFYQQAKEAALRALEINNRLSDCHTSMAIVKFYYEWDWAAAERSLCRAIDLEPFSSLAHQIYGRLLSSMRRHEEAIDKAKRSCELEPLSAQSHFILGEILYFARQYDQALEAFNTALEFDEMHGPAMLGAGNVYCQMSMFDAAISRMERANALHPDNAAMLALLGAAYARAGRTGAARTTLSKLQAFSKHRYVSPFDLALITAGLGQKNKAIEFLHGAYEESSPLLAKFLLPGNPAFDGLQDDGRYADLVKRVRGNNRKVVV